MRESQALYDGLFDVTRKYLSDASVKAAVGTALKRKGHDNEILTAENLAAVVAEAMVGLRLFCKPEDFGDLMMDLTEYCEQLRPDTEGKP